ncbi:MAG TPA: aldolase/citrate lyase family protein [Caulobacteraceae bacterium]|jgi:2-keto-3-deoxy-L-rhamnonate aldolase RhmA
MALREKVRSGQRVIGVFIKTASHQVVELIGRAGLDFAIVDAEHAPFDLLTLDRMALAARAWDLPLLVRPAGSDAAFVGQVLDMGFSGIVAPHVDSAQAARSVADAARFDRGRRGFSPSTRAGGYGATDARAYCEVADRETSLWCQIEDASALPRLDEIAAVDEIDCLFLGRADLALSLGVDSQSDPQVVDAVRATAEVARRAGRTVGIFVGSSQEIAPLAELGISVFVCGSDQSWLLAQGRAIRSAFDAARG